MFFTFKGGIHPPERKEITEEKEFTNLSVPRMCYVPLLQHIGAPAEAVVEIGDHVEEGQLIAEAKGLISSNVHAPVPGKVVDIVDHMTLFEWQKTIVIEAEGAFTASAGPGQNTDWESVHAADILEKIRDAGIVGLGGAAFPTAVKLSPPPGKEIDVLVVNGAECEPYLTVDDMLMKTYPGDIIEGIRIALKVLGIKKAVIGIEDNKKTAASRMNEALAKIKPDENITVKTLRTKYPQGAEKQLIYSLLKRVVPSGSLPMDVGVVVQNVGTLYAVKEAVVSGKSLFERYVTVSGEMINKPGNYKVRIGTRIQDIIEECGGLKGDPSKVVIGGPMCGVAVHTMEIPVIKGTSGILFLSEEEIGRGDYTVCIRCGKCVAACPVGLLPCEIGSAVEKNRYKLAAEYDPMDCIMCGSCAYCCPANRPLSHFIRLARERMPEK